MLRKIRKNYLVHNQKKRLRELNIQILLMNISTTSRNFFSYVMIPTIKKIVKEIN